MNRSNRLWLCIVALAVASGASPTATNAQLDDAVLAWLASGRDGVPCMSPEACDVMTSYACLDERCTPVGSEGRSCRPADHILGHACDVGLACENSVCEQAGGYDQPCLPCDDHDTMMSCLHDRCDYSLGCDQGTFHCLPAGDEDQPCREEGASCNDGMQCIAGTCIAVGDESQPCSPDRGCNLGLFCEPDNQTCTIQPRGLTASMDTEEETACVAGVEGQFHNLVTSTKAPKVTAFDAKIGQQLPPDYYAVAPFSLNAFATSVDHMQGICKLPGTSSYKFLFTRSAEGSDTAGVMIADDSASRFLYAIEAKHPGGLSMFGDRIAIAVELGYDNPKGWIEMMQYNRSSASSPLDYVERIVLNDSMGGDRLSSVAYTLMPDRSELMFVLGQQSEEGWLVQRRPGDDWRLLYYFPDGFSSFWSYHGVWRMFQNVHFVNDCSGALYIVASSQAGGTNYADLYLLEATGRGTYRLDKKESWRSESNSSCDARYAANPIIRAGTLSYICAGGTAGGQARNLVATEKTQ